MPLSQKALDAIKATIADLTAQVNALVVDLVQIALSKASVTVNTGAITPVVSTPLPPGPPPVVTITKPNLARTLCFTGYLGNANRYQRDERVMIVSATKFSVKVITCNFSVGGAVIPFGVDTTLTLTLDGQAVATTAVKATDIGVVFTLLPTVLAGLAEKWYMGSVTGLDSTWSVIEYGIYVLKGTVALPPTVMPVVTGSHEMIFEGQGTMQKVMVPAKFEPITVPYEPRTFPDVPTLAKRKDLIITSLAVERPDDLYRPARTKEGVWTTANIENYFYSIFEAAKPVTPMLDGPRGRGSIIAPVHLEVGNAAPGGVLRGNVYFIESWRVGKVTPNGTVITLAGYRHKDMASYWEDPTAAELVGDWSSIPVERRGFQQPWGMAWDQRTLVIDEQAPTIPSENDEHPHVLGPVLFVSDTYRNRIIKIQYIATAHGVPPKVTEYIVGLNQPWDCLIDGTTLIVSDRMNYAIKFYDITDPLVPTLVRTISAVQPEGMALLDGWLYYASVKSKSIRKRNLITDEDVLIADPSVVASNMAYFIDGNSRYMKIAVSDGSLYPRGTIAYTTWSNRYYGYPNLITPTGTSIDWIRVEYYEKIKGLVPNLGSYATAVGFGHGRMLFGTAEEGLHVLSAALSTDVYVDPVKYRTGMTQWRDLGYGLTHGPEGFGFYGLPLPWGVTPEIDYFLQVNGHAKP